MPHTVLKAQKKLLHNDYFENLRATEYHRLDSKNHTYLDYTGGNLYSDSQLLKHFGLLKENTFGNPHSTNPTSQFATTLVEQARQDVIDFFNAEDYICIFTQNASGALKIVGECYPFDENGCLLLLSDNHNSVNGIREFCKKKYSHFEYSAIQYEDLTINEAQLQEALVRNKNFKNKLFAYPAQSNVSGVKHDLRWVEKAQNLGWDVLLDAAAFVPTNTLDLRTVNPNFLCVSFYKIFGYPTGLGCLLVRKDSFNKLEKVGFSGGNVTLVSVQTDNFFLTDNHERFENGTINYLDIPAISDGLTFIKKIGMERLGERVSSLRQSLYASLNKIKHSNGNKVVKIFGPSTDENIGGTLIMNFFDQNGNAYPFEWIENKANQEGISIRSGCFCNPGIDEIKNCLTGEEMTKYYSSRTNGNFREMMQFLNKMRGATRVSVGIATVEKDLDKFIEFCTIFRDKNWEEFK